MHRKNLKCNRNYSFDSVIFLLKRREFEYRDERTNESRNMSGTCVSRGNLYLRKSAEVRIQASSFAVEKSSRGQREGEIEWFEVAFRGLPDIKSDRRRNRVDGTVVGRGEIAGRSARRCVTGRHKVPFVPIKTSGTEYVDMYKEKKEEVSARVRDGTGWGTSAGDPATIEPRSFRRSRPLTKFAIYDPGKAKRTSFHDVAGRFLPFGNDTIETQTRVVRGNEEDIGRGIRFKGAERC